MLTVVVVLRLNSSFFLPLLINLSALLRQHHWSASFSKVRFFLDKKVYNKSAWLEWKKFFWHSAIYWITTMKKAFMKFLISLQNFPLLQLVRGNEVEWVSRLLKVGYCCSWVTFFASVDPSVDCGLPAASNQNGKNDFRHHRNLKIYRPAVRVGKSVQFGSQDSWIGAKLNFRVGASAEEEEEWTTRISTQLFVLKWFLRN